MGWAACTGTLDPGAFVLGGFLYCWQFPHFKALSWNLRAEYSRAGYRMSSVLNPNLCRRVCLRHSIAMLPLSALAAYLDMTSWWFVVDSLPFNLYLIYLSAKFYQEGSSNSSKKLFRFSLVHIPVILLLMILSKNRTTSAVDEAKTELSAWRSSCKYFSIMNFWFVLRHINFPYSVHTFSVLVQLHFGDYVNWTVGFRRKLYMSNF